MMLAYSKIAFRIGDFEVAWYALCILIGIVLAATLAVCEAKRLGINPNDIFDGLLWILPLAILGARLYFVVFDAFNNGSYYNWNVLKMLGFTYTDGSISGFRLEGLGIQGGVIFAGIGILIYCKIKKLNVWKIVDLVAIGFLVGQICGRWGNFFNQEVYGAAVDNLNFLPSFISDQMFINGSYRQPLFLYEGIWNLTALITFLIIRRHKLLKIGDMFAIYLVWYGIGRAWMEPLRDTAYILTGFGGSMQSVVMSLMFILAGAGLLVFKYLKFKDLPYYHEEVMSLMNEENIFFTEKVKRLFKNVFKKKEVEVDENDSGDSI